MSGDGAFMIRMLIFFLFFVITVVSSVTLIREARSWITRLKFKRAIFSGMVLGVFVIICLVAQKCCVSWQNGLILSICATAVYASFAGTFFFEPTASYAEKKEKNVAPERKDYLMAIFPVVVIFLLSYGAYCCGYCFSTSFIIWLFGSFIILAAIVVYGEVKS
ncbi:MAG: hypothetical protein QMD77_04055 [Patescibacteria group bacterium]|nr:hypothetical protein [Patescibacteria group bacterium]